MSRSVRLLGAAATILVALLSGCAAVTPTVTDRPTVTITPLIHVTTHQSAAAHMDPIAPPAPVVDPHVVFDYFSEIAFGSEFGRSDHAIHKWTRSPTIAVVGHPTPSDLATLRAVVAELNEIIDSIDLVFTASAGDITVHFVPQTEFGHIVSDYVQGNIGFFSTRWQGPGTITSGQVLISTTITERTLRDHVIREEITQALGLAQDSHTHADSIFFQGFSSTTGYSDIDRSIIAMLYRPEITPGMTREQAYAALAVHP